MDVPLVHGSRLSLTQVKLPGYLFLALSVFFLSIYCSWIYYCESGMHSCLHLSSVDRSVIGIAQAIVCLGYYI